MGRRTDRGLGARGDERGTAWPALLAVLLLAGCQAKAQGTVYASPIVIHAEPLPLSHDDPGRTAVGELTYAGGFKLAATGTGSFGGVSGIDVADDGVSFIAQEDVGGLVRGRLKLDAQGRLEGVEAATFQLLVDEHGHPYGRKVDADAEDVTLTPDGYAVSYEQDHRVLAYPAAGGPGVRLPNHPDIFKRPPNSGLEALAWREGRLYEGAEDGEVWRCDPRPGPPSATACTRVMKTSPFPGYSLTGLDAAGRGFVAVYRAVDPFDGWRATLAWLEPAAPDGSGPWTAHRLAVLDRPLTRDNMEGIAAVPRPGGGFRLYLVSDDNFSRHQRTLLLAFDWPGPPPLPAPAGRR